jgi:hypothetical protein
MFKLDQSGDPYPQIVRKEGRLAARWCPSGGIIADVFPRQTNADLHFLFSEVFTKEVCESLQRRGYDLSTLRFQIDKKVNDAQDPT